MSPVVWAAVGYSIGLALFGVLMLGLAQDSARRERAARKAFLRHKARARRHGRRAA